MKVLAIVGTHGNSNIIRPEAEQFIEMHKMGIQVDIMCHPDTEYEKIFASEGIKIAGAFPQNKKDEKATAEIRNLLVSGNYEILHVLNRTSIACGIKAAKGLSVKVVAYRGASGLYWHDPTAYENVLNPRVDKVICVCNDIRDNLRKQLFFKNNKAVTIYKGHRLEWYQAIQGANFSHLNISDNAFVIACSANNRKWKGIPTFLEAVNLIPEEYDFHVLLLGDGMDTPYYKKRISNNNNASKIHVLGYQDKVLEIVKSAHVSMQTSYKNEGLSRSTIEAMSMGIVPIVTNAGGNAELVMNEECGLVVPVKNARKMANAIIRLYNDRDLLSKFSSAATKRILNHFSVEKTATETIKVYNDLLGK